MKIHSTSRKIAITLAATACSVFAQTATLGPVYTLDDIRLGVFQPSIPATDPVGGGPGDHGFLLGSIGSGLFRSFLEGSNVYWMVTDRGPNPMNGTVRTFPVADFTPHLIKVRTDGTKIEILQKVPLKLPNGMPVTGIPNLAGRDEVALSCGPTPVGSTPFNPNGLDTEDLTRTLDGNFWLVEEHTTSIVKVSPNGVVLKRFVPHGLALPGAGYAVSDKLPGIYSRRRQNRGFEGIALGWDLRTLYAALQNPLSNPPANATATPPIPNQNNSRNTRILAFDAYSEVPKAEYVYRMSPVAEFGGTVQGDVKVSGVVALDPWRLLVLERTDARAKIYRVDLTKATNILGSVYDNPATTLNDPNIESETGFATSGVVALPKELIVDLGTLPGIPEKIEGITILDWNTIAVSNDNDFDVGPTTCELNVGPGTKNSIFTINLSKPLIF
jgi:hypothetical protein